MGLKIYRPNLMPSGASPNQEQILDYLEKNGLKICDYAAHFHTTKRETGNQENAYGFVVYYNGEPMRVGKARVWPATEPAEIGGKEYWGDELFSQFIEEYTPELSGYTLVIFNAMPYSSWHELGQTPKQRKYKILSQSWWKLMELAGTIVKDLNLPKDFRKQITTWWWSNHPEDYEANPS